MINPPPVLKVAKLVKSYKDASSTTEVLRGLDLAIERGESVAIMGASGCGKSTLLHCLAGLDDFQDGTVKVLGQAIKAMNESKRCALRAESLGFIYQFHHLLPEFSALENIVMPLWLHKQSGKAVRQQALEMLDAVGLKEKAQQNVQTLSGGERQRIAIARALVNRPQIILADEPTGNLDEASAERVMDLLLKLNTEQGSALLLVTHNKVIAKKCDRTLVLRHGLLEAQ
jgi:lipoprotein-releasing system ATP-binding protein